MKAIVDTNVALVANKKAHQASVDCVLHCIDWLESFYEGNIIVIDNDGYIVDEYGDRLNYSGQPGAGDRFFRWLVLNQANPECCDRSITINPTDDLDPPRDFMEFPTDPALADFDPSDRKFVAVAYIHPEHPPVLDAVDSDWWHYREVLERNGVHVRFLCPDYKFKK